MGNMTKYLTIALLVCLFIAFLFGRGFLGKKNQTPSIDDFSVELVKRPSIDDFSAEVFNGRLESKNFKKGLPYADAISYLRGNLIATDIHTVPVNGEYPHKGTSRYTEKWEDTNGLSYVMMTRVGLLDQYYQGEQVLMVFDEAIDKSLVLKDVGMRVRYYTVEPQFENNDSFSSWTTFESYQYSAELASFTDLKIGQSRIAAIDVVRLLHAPEQGAKIIKTSSTEFKVHGGVVMLLSASGLADDSVHAEEFFLIFEGEGTAQKLAAFGLRVKCARGENTAQWQKTPCP